jgi:uncharacterized protein (TIGR02996 family)
VNDSVYGDPNDAAFIRAIVDRPDDDAPRLIYADWLDDRGESDRAELIRIQIESVSLTTNDPQRRLNDLRAEELIRKSGVEWTRRLQPDSGPFPGVQFLKYERGFLSVVLFSKPEEFLEHAERLTHLTPLTEMRFHAVFPQQAQEIAKSPALRHIRTLDFGDGNRLGNAGVEALMASPHLGNLRKLDLQRNALGSTAVRAIARSESAQSIESLELSNNDLYSAAAEEIAFGPALHRLEFLNLGTTRLGDAGVVALARSPQMASLKHLYLNHNDLTDEAALAISRSPHLAQLRSLFLDRNSISDPGAQALANTETLANLEWLYLRQNRIGEPGARALAATRSLLNLRELIVGENPLGAAAGALLGRFGSRVHLH